MAKKLPERRDRVGFCIFLLASEGFWTGFIRIQRKACGTGPQWIYFGLRAPCGVPDIPMVECLYDYEIRPEVWELEVISKIYPKRLDSDVMETIPNVMNSDHNYELDYGLNDDEGQPTPSPSDDARHTMDALTQQIQSLFLDSFYLTQGSRAKTVAINNKAPGSSEGYDLQDTVYAPFWVISRTLRSS